MTPAPGAPPPGAPTGSLSGRAARGTAWLALVTVFSKGSQIVVTLALGAFLSRSELGAISIAVVVVNIGQTLQSMGVYDVISRTRAPARQFAGTVATLSVGVAVVVAAAVFAAGGVITTLIGSPTAAWPLRIVALGLPFTAYFGVQTALMHRELDFRKRLVPDAGSAVTGSAVTVVGAAMGLGVWALVAGMLVTAVLGPVLGLAVGMRIPLRLHRAHAGETLRWVRTVGTAGVLGVLLLNVDYIVVTRVLGEEANGLYSYAFRFAFVPFIMIAFVIGGVAFPVYARLMERDGVAALGAAFARVVHVLVASTGGLYLLLALLAPRIVVIDERWAPSAAVLRVLCLYGLVLGIVQACHDAVRAAGRPGLYLRAMTLHLLLLLGTAVTFVHLGGIVGVAWAQVVSACTTLAVAAAFLTRAGVLAAPVLRTLRRALLGPALATGVTTAVDLAAARAGWLPPAASLPGLLVTGTLLGLCYAGVLWLVDRSAVRELRTVLGS